MTRGTAAFLAASTKLRYPSVSVRELSAFVRAEWAVKPAALAITASARGSAVRARCNEPGSLRSATTKSVTPRASSLARLLVARTIALTRAPLSSRAWTIADPNVPEAPTTVTIFDSTIFTCPSRRIIAPRRVEASFDTKVKCGFRAALRKTGARISITAPPILRPLAKSARDRRARRRSALRNAGAGRSSGPSCRSARASRPPQPRRLH